MAYIFQFRPMFFETPQVIGPWSSVAPINNLESYLLMSNSYILLVTNINTKFQCLLTEHNALLERNRNIFSEKPDLEDSVN
jgi:hypothetical protein